MIDGLLANEADWRLTPIEVRKHKGFENATDEDVENIIDTLALLGRALYEAHSMQQGKENPTK